MENVHPIWIQVVIVIHKNEFIFKYACYYDEKIKTFLGDVYSVKWLEDSDKENLRKETLEQQFHRVKKETNTSQGKSVFLTFLHKSKKNLPCNEIQFFQYVNLVICQLARWKLVISKEIVASLHLQTKSEFWNCLVPIHSFLIWNLILRPSLGFLTMGVVVIIQVTQIFLQILLL